MWRYIGLVTAIIVLVNCVSESSRSGGDISQRKIRVVATTGMIGDAARNLGGERVEVKTLMGPGVDPHLYKASEGDVMRMFEADIILYNGLHLEGKMGEVFEKMGNLVKTVAVTETIQPEKLLAPPEFEGNYDPHIWFNVDLWLRVTDRITEAFINIDSLHGEVYRSNLSAYRQELEQLHQYVLQQAAGIPPENRVLVTAHDAFNYFGLAYGFEVRGLQGISTASEAGTADVQNLADFIVERKIPAVFVESSVPPRSIEALKAAVKSRGFEVKIGGNLFSDSMGDAGSAAGNYIGMVRHNIDTIVRALKSD